MKLETLMDQAFDEDWFCVVTPDGEEHYFWNADYLGWHPDVMPELKPLLKREFDEFSLVIRPDPENDAINAPKVPMVYVALNPTKKEIEARRKAAELHAKNLEKCKAKHSKGRKRRTNGSSS